ncbi:MAG: hypothetical protein J5978_09580 [Spirochaetaceae bacterium]|nr:hypothetical protein [Spirochaetaceae bacterium]MBO5483561.1 hypothetical protein [Spirochaetaceae bacterium]
MPNNDTDLIRVSLNTRNFRDTDPITGQVFNTYKGALNNLDKDLNAFEKVIKSATNYFEFFNSNLKKIDPKTGYAEQSFFVRKEELDNVLKVLRAKSSELSVMRDGDYAFDVHAVENIKATKTIHGRKAQRMAMEEIDFLGGKAVVNANDPDKLDISLPVDKSMLHNMTQRQKNALITKSIPRAIKLSDIERKKEKEESDIREAETEAKEEKKRQVEEVRKGTTITKGILAILTIVADLIRRLLVASLDTAKENNKRAVESHSVGVTRLDRRNYDIFDKAHGMEEGTTFGAIQTIQGKFGDVTNLDEKALSTLARVMGSSVADLVKSGIGGQNPSALLDSILDKYFKQYLSGKNSLGQTVGLEQARRELITTLQSVSPEIAKLFAQMTDDYSSGYYEPFTDTKSWRGTTPLNRSGLSQAELAFSTEVGKKYNEILAIVDDLKTSFFTRLATSMDGLLTSIKNLRIGQSDSNKLEEDLKNRDKNERSAKTMQEQIKLYNASAQKRLDELDEVRETPISKNALGSNNYSKAQADRFKYDIDTLAGIYLGMYDEDYFAKNFKEGTGMLSGEKREVKAYIKRGKDIIDSAFFDKEIQDELARAIVNKQQIAEIEEMNKNKAGSGKIADIAMTKAKQNLLAQNVITEYTQSLIGRSGSYSALNENQKEIFVDAYFSYLKSNPDAYKDRAGNLDKTTGKVFKEKAKEIAKAKGIRDVKDLPLVDKMKALAEADVANWRAMNFIPQQYLDTKGTAVDTHLRAKLIDEMKTNFENSNSLALNLIEESGLQFAKNTPYSIKAEQGQSGEYILYIQAKDSKGNNIGQPYTISSSDTKGQTGYLGDMVVDSQGGITYNTTN